MALSTTDIKLISVTGTISGMFGICGSLFVILAYVVMVFRRKRNRFWDRLVCYLSVSTFMWTSALMTGMLWTLITDGVAVPEFLCFATGFMLQWFSVSDFFWIATVALYLYLWIVRRVDLQHYETLLHFVCWGIPFVIAVSPLFLKTFMGWRGYGNTGAWCWLQDSLERLFLCYFFAWVTFFIIVFAYLLVIFNIRDYIRKAERLRLVHAPQWENESRRVLHKLASYPVIFCISWIPGTVNRLQNFLDPENPLVWLYALHIGAEMLSGFMNAFAYFIVNRWKDIQSGFAEEDGSASREGSTRVRVNRTDI